MARTMHGEKRGKQREWRNMQQVYWVDFAIAPVVRAVKKRRAGGKNTAINPTTKGL